MLCRGQRIITTFAGSDPTYPSKPFPANSASFGQLISTAVSPSGDVYFVSETRSMILKLTVATSTVSVVAGIGIGGYSGDGGPATRAELNNPQGIAFDPAGNLYVADDENSVIRKIDTQGTITTLAKAFDVVGVTVAPDGTLYASNYYQILHINSNGTTTVVAGGAQPGFGGDGGPATQALLSNASGLIFDHAGNLLIADSLNNRIRRIDTKGIITTIAGNGQGGSSAAGPATATAIGYPIGLALDANGNLYTGSFESGQVQKIDPSGQLSILNPNPSTFFLTAPGPVAKAQMIPAWPAFDAAGDLYIADFAGFLWEVTPSGTIQVVAAFSPNFNLGDGGPAALAGLNAPGGVAVGPNGSVLIAEQFNDRIRRVASSGTITTVIGNGTVGFTSPGPAASASLYIPNAVAADSSGNVYVASAGVVFEANPAGALTLFYQGAAGANAIGTDAQGNLLVATSGNQIVRVSPGGTATVIAGTGKAGFTGDGGAATAATLNGPTGVAADAVGNIYVSDTGNYRIRKISTSGIITTIVGGGASEVDGVPGPQSSGAPQAVAADKFGNVYFVEVNPAKVREIASNGIVSTIAGTGAIGFLGDGGLATAAQLNEPYGVAVDDAGNVFIADRLNNRIREIPVAPPSISVSSTQTTISAPSSGAPAQTNVTVSTSAQGVGYSLSFSTNSGGNWLSASLTQGQAPGAFSIIADPTNLAPNTYQGTVTVTSPYAVPPTQTISVTLQVTSGTPPQLAAGNGPLSFSVFQGSAPTTSQLTVSNQGGGSLSFTAFATTATGGSWLQISPAGGTATASTPVSVTVTATPGTLGAGTYSGSITVSSTVSSAANGTNSGPSITVPVTLSVNAAQQQILLSQTALTFTAVAGGGAPLPQSFGILNTGQGSMNWSASANTLSGGSWLNIDQSSGTVTTPFTDVSLVNGSISASGLSAGTYYAQIQVTAPGAPNSPQSVSVVLNVLPAGSSPGAEIRPTGLIFIGAPGSSPGSQTLMISNPQASAITFGGSFFTVPTGGNWAKFLPANATVQPSAPISMVVQPDYTNLTSGTYQGFVSLGFADGSSRSVHVLAVVAPAASQTSSSSLAAAATSSCSPIQIQPTSLTDPGSTVTVGVGVSLQVRAVDSCRNLITSSNGAVAATFSNGDAAVNLVHEGNGNWGGTWTPRKGASSQVQVVYEAFEGSGTKVLSGSANVTVAVQPAGTTPLTFGAANAASGLGAFISPGGLVSIYGHQLAGAAVTSGNPPFPSNVNGTQVLMGGAALPLRYVGDGQINAQVPFGLGINTQQQLIVQNGTTLSVPQNVVVAAAQPGIYTQDQSGTGPGVIVDFNTGQEVTTSHPAHIGDTLTIYSNGLGAVNPPVPTGTPAPSVEPLARTVNPVTVTIGGVNAQVEFAGLAPGYPDLYQVNAVVPLGVQPGDSVPVVLTLAGQSSPAAVTMAVQ
ncbi:MAG TPA: SMP-30/gluconolactonase/LRE family protein [Bryobacteraceae bacterium]|nr:SMP-30/gluconolactonase/LRE family protein [Bryobacteraceae bacterium]